MLLGSGAVVGTMAIPCGPLSPEINEAFTTAPEVVYSPIVPPPTFPGPRTVPTKRSEPDTAMLIGSFNPEINEGFTKAPEVVYSATVPEKTFAINRSEPDTAMRGLFKPEISEAFTVAPEVVYSPIVLVPAFPTKRFEPDSAMTIGSSNPEINEAFTVAPEVVYAPTLPVYAVDLPTLNDGSTPGGSLLWRQAVSPPPVWQKKIGIPTQIGLLHGHVIR
jgi:hypothetical protein